MKEAPENSNLGVWTGMAILISVLVIGLFVRQFSLLILFLLSVGTLIGLVYYAIRYAMEWQKSQSQGKTVGGKIEKLISECSAQIAKYRLEIKDIQQNIKDLEHRLKDGFEINPKSIEESKRIQEAFLKEQQLRETKISFYEHCRAKLENMLYNQKLADELEVKQQKLNQLQEDHFEDIAHMEQVRTELEYEKQFLESISKLSDRMAGINSLDVAEEIQLELKSITKELGRL